MKKQQNDILIRTQIRPGDIGEIIRIHGVLYAEEYGWDYTFEGYVANSFGEFVLAADRERSRLWIVEKDSQLTGSIGIVGRAGSGEAQLRWFWVSREIRGRGFGHLLMREALLFCREREFESVFLWTVSELEDAARVYRSFGFQKTEDKTHFIWGKMITEVRYDLLL